MRLMLMMIRIMSAGTDRAADGADIASRLRQQGAHGHETAAAIRPASKAAIGLSRGARPVAFFGFESRENLGIGQDVTGTNNHARLSVAWRWALGW